MSPSFLPIFEPMIYPENFEQKINFDNIRNLISAHCLCVLGQEKVASMHFSTDHHTLSQRLKQTDEFLKILQCKEEFPTQHFLDFRSTLIQVGDDHSTWLAEKEIPLLAAFMETAGKIVAFLSKTVAGQPSYPELKKLADQVITFPSHIEKANSVLDKSGQIKDNASRSLADIRKNKLEAAKEVTRSMQAALRSAQAQGIVAKDVHADVRGGYYLIPVSASNKRKIKGIIRDDSGSGKTVYIEPEAVVAASSHLRDLENSERREIARILIEFTNLLRPDLPDILGMFDFMGNIDFIRAKAMFAVKINACKPLMQNKPCIDWNQAVHPILDLTLRQQKQQAQPLDIQLTSCNRILIVSGVNAGGKSLCLKTVALLQYMLQCGLLIPVAHNSAAGIFEHIFLDIGDGQHMQNSLSTYTAHLTNMKHFIENSNEKALLLIDEFGGGTEPQIGGAIAETLLDQFNKKRSFGLITTHFQNLKHFAYRTDGVINGAMLYDSEKMQPMYKLSIGQPGSSLAIEVARRIGLPEEIISDAAQKVGEDFI